MNTITIIALFALVVIIVVSCVVVLDVFRDNRLVQYCRSCGGPGIVAGVSLGWLISGEIWQHGRGAPPITGDGARIVATILFMIAMYYFWSGAKEVRRANSRRKAAEPGATDNPDGAQ